MRNFLSKLSQPLKRNTPRGSAAASKPAVTDRYGFAVRPHVSLKARMLGGQAETVLRLRGLER